jgi:DNA-binding MarR family transcriptional regulator
VSQLSAKLNAHAVRLLRKHGGLSLVQWRILYLLEVFGTASSKQLATFSGMDTGLVSRNLRMLIESGLVKSRLEPADLRQSNLRITAAGRKVYEKAVPHMQARREALWHGVSDADKRVFLRVFDQLDNNAAELLKK